MISVKFRGRQRKKEDKKKQDKKKSIREGTYPGFSEIRSFSLFMLICNDSEPCEMEEKSRIMFT